ncbi:helix-turn-helix transcriptional regulator [Halomonas sp. H10-9-1]
MARRLRECLAAATRSSRQGEEPVFSLRLPHRPGDHGLLVLICALGQSPESSGEEACVVALLSAPSQRPPLPRGVLASLFGLTPTETRIALALLEGLRSEEIAEQMGVSPTTVAFHLRNLFQKTDTHRQADLIALLMAGSMTAYLEGR